MYTTTLIFHVFIVNRNLEYKNHRQKNIRKKNKIRIEHKLVI